ncbi:MAG: transposase [Spirochaetaceae bacterium]|jgi:REP element-mobilizing transposase RayT|nr:transposase [Spirochaetaceae bacterium]
MAAHNLPRGLTDQGLTYHVLSAVNRFAFELQPDEMKKLFLTVIEEAKTSKGFKFKLWNFCIMDNHFHFLITPEKGQSLSEILKWIKMVFAIRWNKKHNKTGHFWGDRFYSSEIKDEKDFWTVYNYIDQNPVAAELVQKPEDWQYSGAYHREHSIVSIVSLVTDTAWRTDLKLLL